MSDKSIYIHTYNIPGTLPAGHGGRLAGGGSGPHSGGPGQGPSHGSLGLAVGASGPGANGMGYSAL